jgi:hypothetical protein
VFGSDAAFPQREKEMKKTMEWRRSGVRRMLATALLLSAALLPKPASAGLKDDLEVALKKYCVPQCDSDCRIQFEAKYDDIKKICECSSSYLKYDGAKRECVISCPAGTFVDGSKVQCGTGSRKLAIPPQTKG